MEITFTTKFNPGDRVWMPDGNGGKMKGRVKSLVLFMADLAQDPRKTVWRSLNCHCVDIDGNEYCFHEWQLEARNL